MLEESIATGLAGCRFRARRFVEGASLRADTNRARPSGRVEEAPFNLEQPFTACLVPVSRKQRPLEQARPVGLAAPDDAPFLHRPPVTGIETLTSTRSDELIDSALRELGDELTPHEHGENSSIHLQPVARHQLTLRHPSVLGEGVHDDRNGGVDARGRPCVDVLLRGALVLIAPLPVAGSVNRRLGDVV